MPGAEYAHQIGEMLESCTTSEERVQLARLIVTTRCPDAEAYLLGAIAEETDEEAAAVIRQALSDLAASLAD